MKINKESDIVCFYFWVGLLSKILRALYMSGFTRWWDAPHHLIKVVYKTFCGPLFEWKTRLFEVWKSTFWGVKSALFQILKKTSCYYGQTHDLFAENVYLSNRLLWK